ncbi:MAG: hypothetical protein DCF12_20155, partial [Snowella sp.]
MLVSIVKKYWILGSLVIVMVPHPFLSSQVLAQSKTLVQAQPQILLSQLTATDRNLRGNAKQKSEDNQGAIADFNQWILGSLVIATVSLLSLKILAQGKTFVQPQPHTLSQVTAIDYYNRGLAKSDSGDYQGAIADYNQAIKLNPDYALAYCNRGNSKVNLGDYQGAIADYNQAIKLNP